VLLGDGARAGPEGHQQAGVGDCAHEPRHTPGQQGDRRHGTRREELSPGTGARELVVDVGGDLVAGERPEVREDPDAVPEPGRR